MDEPQIEPLLDGLRAVLGADLLGVYLHGSAVLGGLKPHSDLDVLAVILRSTGEPAKRQLVDLLLGLSGSPRPIEVDLVVQSEIRPWRYPPPFDFHFDELLREEFEAGNLEPWASDTNVDLASAITMALAGDAVLSGPPPAVVFDPVPRDDYVQAVLRDTKTVDEYLPWDTRNVVLTLPRIWTAVATDEVHSKETAARWALERLPAEHRPLLERALAVYLGQTDDEPWGDALPRARAYAAHVVAEIARATG